MYKVAMTKALAPGAMHDLAGFAEAYVLNETEPEKILAKMDGMDALIFRGNVAVNKGFFQGLKERGVKVYAKHGTGLDGIDLEAAEALGIPVVFAPGANARSVAEYTVSLMLAMIKQIPQVNEQSHQADISYRWTYRTKQFRDMTVFVVGYGNIGRQVAKMCMGLDMRVIAYDKFMPREKIEATGALWVSSIPEGLKQADIVSIHTPLTEETAGLVSAPFLDDMKPGAYLVNTARPELLDEREICRRLEDGSLAGAAFDACSIESGAPSKTGLENARNLIFSCHIAAQTEEAVEAMGMDCIQGILAVLQGKRWAKTANPRVYDVLGY